MLSEKQLIDLIQALQASNFSASEIFWLCIGLIAVALFMSYLVSISTEKGKIAAINANYERVREQLSLNTTTIKDIEKKITSELWISQQVWQKKYDMYELVYAQLLNIKKWADNEFRIIELHMIPRWIESSYQPYFNEEQEKQFYEEIKQAQAELERVVNDEEFQIKNADLEKKLSFAMTSLTEVLITKAIILHPNIEIILNRLIENIGSTPSPEDEEEPDDYAYRVKNAIDTALNEIKTTALSDLEIRQQKN
ncbi:hypothetical protein M0K99_RS03515 [Citrobacter freundii]|uniref:hypothetical protein n=2 Tax=Citrobacter freundii TaxID=546 RepID=UPI001C7CE316|nr:hypothetical protein [Citrobacter freundii]EJD6418584.1 hypothetical protein [Citrobacter freundii]EJD6622151.1 hypothetical protein [Citrobacter freundii]EKX7352341.1 hypothetical protein [Citrobacter freundii]EKY1458525.1 hypothetical protein [Citrobacter freundii]WIJ93117.1 hypothetical protein OI904_16700 [Citrobacter freundii]